MTASVRTQGPGTADRRIRPAEYPAAAVEVHHDRVGPGVGGRYTR